MALTIGKIEIGKTFKPEVNLEIRRTEILHDTEFDQERSTQVYAALEPVFALSGLMGRLITQGAVVEIEHLRSDMIAVTAPVTVHLQGEARIQFLEDMGLQ